MNIDKEIETLIAKHSLAQVIAALSRYVMRPKQQHYPVRKMQTLFRRLSALYEYCIEG